jgi:hypothetical protein
MHAMSGSGDITKMGGLRKLPMDPRRVPGLLAGHLGVPPFSGFFSKDAIIAGAFAHQVYGRGSLGGPAGGPCCCRAALGTAFYMSRLYFLVFTGTCRADEQTKAPHPRVAARDGGAAGGAGRRRRLSASWVPGGLFAAPRVEPARPLAGAVARARDARLARVEVGPWAPRPCWPPGIGLAWVFYGGGYREPARKFAAACPASCRWCATSSASTSSTTSSSSARSGAVRGLFLVVDRILIDQVLVGGGGWWSTARAARRAFQAGDVQRYVAVVRHRRSRRCST